MAGLRDENLLVVNSAREGSVAETMVATEEDLDRVLAQAAEAGVRAELVRGTHRNDSPSRSSTSPTSTTPR